MSKAWMPHQVRHDGVWWGGLAHFSGVIPGLTRNLCSVEGCIACLIVGRDSGSEAGVTECCGMGRSELSTFVMPGLDPGTHVFLTMG